ncbi:MAG: transcription-repair coupling factor [Candidatus Palauibacterales bacterium]|nr:transcription-repair coupling factor [Candidatus Palauibacterales bacterium]
MRRSFELLLEERDDARWPGPGEKAHVRGLPGAGPSLLIATLHAESGRHVVLVTDTPGEAELRFADLETLGVSDEARYMPQRETLPYEEADPHVEISSRRVEAIAAVLEGRAGIIVTTSRALVERTPVGGAGSFGLDVTVGDRLARGDLAARLDAMGFEATTGVRELGDYVVRGGIVDVFPFGTDEPIRIELWDDRVESLRNFDLLSQRSTGRLNEVTILPVELSPDLLGASAASIERRSLLELLPDDALLVFEGAACDEWRRNRLWNEIRAARAELDDETALAAEALVLAPPIVADRLDRMGVVFVDPPDGVAGGESIPTIRLGLEPHPPIERRIELLIDEIRAADGRGERILIMCDSPGQLERMQEILEDAAGPGLARRLNVAIGGLSGGFRIPGPAPMLVLTDHQIFARSRRLRRQRRLHGVAPLESIASLAPGDYVVHLDHGIGRFAGLERVRVGEETVETLKIEYADGEILRVPHYRLDLIEKWSGVGDPDEVTRPPAVHKLGGKKWKRLRSRTEESIRAMATELLDLYAHRTVRGGFAFSPDTRWQREMESSFLYEDTPDQRSAWLDVKNDMESPAIMDRLVCGDVGYGKTEVAIRAAFKAVQDGKQVAVLAPTTILVEQHLHTFSERLAGFPVRVAAFSRLRTREEQKAALRDLVEGRIDVAIGTHRLLSRDVVFKDLGLLVVDEEQRFGVRHKERLKELKRTVDVLTLTATPIPRTLQLALGGLRDLSLIETAPRDRMPVITHVLPWSDGVIQDAIRREMDRSGQVFFVHDRIETIDALAQRVRRLAPDARLAVAHGRLHERDLEDTMAALMDREIDILVSTSIIENGLDVPTANTMIVHRSDRFGLAQLYQLRGRVGRSHHRAYCYLLVPDGVTPEAVQRLRILEHHTELGSGYRVALKDLQLRGAGNLLGADQSGFAQAVGFDTYQRLLERQVRRMRGEEDEAAAPATQVNVEGEAYLPDDYIAGADQKMNLYRRVSRLRTAADLTALEEELRDRFGPIPPTAERLLASVRLRILGTRLGVEWLRVSEADARMNFGPGTIPRLALLRDAMTDLQIAVEVRRTEPLSLWLARAGVEPLLPTLVAALELLDGSPAA